MNYYYKEVIISIRKPLTVDFRWDCNEGVNRWVFVFAYFLHQMNIPAVSRVTGHQCGIVPRAQMWDCA